MTPQDHNKAIGIMHLIYGGFNALMMVFLLPVFAIMIGAINLNPEVPGEFKAIFGAFGVFFLFIAVIFGIPPLLASYGLLRQKSWGRTAAIVSAVLAAISLPFGTALCIYTLWFLFGEGKNFHESQRAGATWQGSLPHASTFGWDAQNATRTRQNEYVPPPQPPNWRDEG